MIKQQIPIPEFKAKDQQEICHFTNKYSHREQSLKHQSFSQKNEQNTITSKLFQAQEHSQALEKRNTFWSQEEDSRLIQLHNQKGNRWVQIGCELKRSDNEVKNYYHSKLRKTFRKINRHFQSSLLTKQYKPLKMNILSKIMQTAQNHYHSRTTQSHYSKGLAAFNLKNKIIQLSQIDQEMSEHDILNVKNLLLEIEQFNRENQKETKAVKINEATKYKAKEIKKLIMENEKNQSQYRMKGIQHCIYPTSTEIKEDHMINHNQQLPFIPTQSKCPQNFMNFQAYYFYNPLFSASESMCYKLFNQSSPQIYSQTQSAFSFVASSLQDKDINRPVPLAYLNENGMRFFISHEFSNNN